MTLLAVIAVCVAFGTWFGIRWSEETYRLNQTLEEALFSIPVHEWTEDELPSDKWPS